MKIKAYTVRFLFVCILFLIKSMGWTTHVAPEPETAAKARFHAKLIDFGFSLIFTLPLLKVIKISRGLRALIRLYNDHEMY